MQTSEAKRIWCAVSGHGFGHLSQITPVLCRLASRMDPLAIHIAGKLPEAVIADKLGLPFSLDPHNRDIGILQSDPITEDLPATREALAALHHDWDGALAKEMAAMSAWKPDLVLADVPYLPIAAASRLGIPVLALSSLSWDAVTTPYFPDDRDVAFWATQMRDAYAMADLVLMPEPAMLPGPFKRREVLPPIVEPGCCDKAHLRRALGIDRQDDRPLVFVSLGGFPLREVPDAAWARQSDIIWLVNHAQIVEQENIRATRRLVDWAFRDISASVDVVVGKPGYNTAVESVAHQVPFLFARRGVFPDEPPICDWLARHSNALELPKDRFWQGDWSEGVRRLLAQGFPPKPPLDGAELAAGIVAEWLLR
ncbi:MAG: hypothetical protein HQL53_05920 [Magnetococcales bacterium]|nr:hypothetical protein [Magnetococcales bacterium]